MADKVLSGFTVRPLSSNTGISINIHNVIKDENKHPIWYLKPSGSKYTIRAGRQICIKPGSMCGLTKGYILRVESRYTINMQRHPLLSQDITIIRHGLELELHNYTQVAYDIDASDVICTIEVKLKYHKSQWLFFVFVYFYMNIP